MANRQLHLRLRKWHRYLGLIFGIQFLFWTIGGIYFSWTKIRTIRGDDIRKELPALPANFSVFSLNQVMDSFRTLQPQARLLSTQIISTIDGKVRYQLHYKSQDIEHFAMADAASGQLLPGIDSIEAGRIALSNLIPKASIRHIQLVSSVKPGDEYRGKPLPAWAVVVEGEANCTVYVGKETGQVHSIRNNPWRVFDFLWMLHILDFNDRDNINNWVLRIVSVMGLVTILSGYVLFFISRKKKKANDPGLPA